MVGGKASRREEIINPPENIPFPLAIAPGRWGGSKLKSEERDMKERKTEIKIEWGRIFVVCALTKYGVASMAWV